MGEKSSFKHLTDADFAKGIAKGVVLVDFYANWCGPCRMLAPVLEQVVQELDSKASIVKVDIDTEQATAAQYQITSVPTMILFKDGKEMKRLIGLKNAAAVKDFILSVV